MRLKLGALLVGSLVSNISFGEQKLFVLECYLLVPDRYLDLKQQDPQNEKIKCLESLEKKSIEFNASSILKLNSSNQTVLRTLTSLKPDAVISPEKEYEIKMYYHRKMSEYFTDCTGEKASTMFAYRFTRINR